MTDKTYRIYINMAEEVLIFTSLEPHEIPEQLSIALLHAAGEYIECANKTHLLMMGYCYCHLSNFDFGCTYELAAWFYEAVQILQSGLSTQTFSDAHIHYFEDDDNDANSNSPFSLN